MVNSLLNSVTKQLGTTFGDKYHYYVENVEQGLVEPAFTVDLLIPLKRLRNSVLYDRTMPLVIHYFSDSVNNKKKECYSIAEQLVDCLEYLPFDGTLLRGIDISWQVVDDVLQFFVTYKFYELREDNTENMESLIENINERND